LEKPSGYIALLDASVLFPVFTSNLLLWLAYRQIYQPKWSHDIHEEWVERRLARYPNASRAALEQKRDRMDLEFEEALVTGYEPLIATLSFSDPDDRHVLAAAISCKAAVIVTNDRDFEHLPKEIEIAAQTADDFIAAQVGVTAGSAREVAIALIKHKRSLTKSRLTWKEYFAEMQRKLPHSYAEFNRTRFRSTLIEALHYLNGA